jgi:hypothetical protein
MMIFIFSKSGDFWYIFLTKNLFMSHTRLFFWSPSGENLPQKKNNGPHGG